MAYGNDDANGDGITDRATDQCIELYNSVDRVRIPLRNYSLWLGANRLYRYRGGSIGAGEHSVTWVREWDLPAGLSTGTLELHDPNGATISTVTIGATNIIGQHRICDGGPWQDNTTASSCGFQNCK